MAFQSPAWPFGVDRGQVTMDLYGHLVDGNLRQAAWVVGGI